MDNFSPDSWEVSEPRRRCSAELITREMQSGLQTVPHLEWRGHHCACKLMGTGLIVEANLFGLCFLLLQCSDLRQLLMSQNGCWFLLILHPQNCHVIKHIYKLQVLVFNKHNKQPHKRHGALWFPFLGAELQSSHLLEMLWTSTVSEFGGFV